jgi:nucleotide-binding universal stress UspA family protein
MVSINHQMHANASSSQTVHLASASPSRVKHILAPTDLREASESAVKYALCLAERLEAKLTLFHVWDVPEQVGGALGALDFERLRKDRDQAEQAF